MDTTYKKKEYIQSDAVNQAYSALQAHQNAKPGAYSSKYQTGIDDTINKIMNREQFSYDLNGDALYQQYKDKYTTQGKLAMMDTMGQASALTGGYGSSYSQAAGQQAYQGYMQQLNDVVPELYQMAYDRYNQEGQDLYNQYGLLSQQEQADYGRYRDSVADYYTDLDYLTGRYDAERNYDYGKYIDDTNFDYGMHRDTIEDTQWEKSYAADEEQRKIVNEQWEKKYAADEEQRKIVNEQWEKEYKLKEQSHELDKMIFESAEEQQAWENLMYETEYADGRKDKATAEAIDLALKLLSMGIMPEADVRSAAGISEESAQAMVDAINAEDSYNKSQDAIAQAGAKAEMMINSGVMPDAETIKAWGVPEETVQAMVEIVLETKQEGIDERRRTEARDIAMTLAASGVEVPRELAAVAGLSPNTLKALQEAFSKTAVTTSVSDLTKISDTAIDLLENYGEETATAYVYMMVQNGYIDENQITDILDFANSSISGIDLPGGADVTVEDIGGTLPETEPNTEEEKKKRVTGGGQFTVKTD